MITEADLFTFGNYKQTNREILSYFLIPLSIENNLIYLFITSSQTGLYKKTQFFLVVGSRSIFYYSKIVYLQIDCFTVYDRILIEH